MGGREGAEVGLYACHGQAGNQVGVVSAGGCGLIMMFVCRSLGSVNKVNCSLRKICA